MFNNKRKSHLSIELRDYVIRALVMKGPSIEQAQLYEIPLPKGIIEEGNINDEMALFELFKEHAANWGGKKQGVRLFVPDVSVLLKSFEHPTDIQPSELLGYVQMEIGHSIHVPFDEPLVDVYDHTPGDGKAILFAAPSDEIYKLMGLFLDIKMTPEVADIRSLSNLRILEKIEFVDEHKTYLIADWSINELSICIFSFGQVEFLRFQMIETELEKWNSQINSDQDIEYTYQGDLHEYQMLVMDAVLELDRMMNFFRYSLHKGEKTVDELVVMGDNPILSQIADTLTENLTVPVKLVDDEVVNKYFPGFKAKHAALLGLALKEAKG